MAASPKSSAADSDAMKRLTNAKELVMVRNTVQMDEMRMQLRRMKAEKEYEHKLINDFQLQKANLESYWNVEKDRRDELHRQYRDSQKQLADMMEKQDFALKVYKYKFKHLLHEQRAGHTDVHIQAQQALKQLQDGQRGRLFEIATDATNIKGVKFATELSHIDQINAIRQDLERRTMLAREEFERKAAEMKAGYEKKMKSVRDAFDEKRKADSAAIEQRKNKHVADLMSKHQQAFDDIKNYYRDITDANLERITQLKADVNAMQFKESDVLGDVHNLERKYKQLNVPLQSSLQLIEKLDADAIQYESDKKELSKTRLELLVLEEKNRSADWEIEIIRQQADQASQERNELKAQLDSKIFAMQQKTGFKNLLLEKKIEGMSEDLEKTESALAEILASTNLPAAIVGDIHHNLEDVLLAKNKQVLRLEDLLAQLKQKYNSTIELYRQKLADRDIPAENLGFNPMSFS